MDRWILAAVCGAALAVAATCALRWGGLTRADRDSRDTSSYSAAALATLRSCTVILYTAGIGGILVAGFGGRLFMRVLGATSPDSLRGTLTEAGEEVGEITVGGTAFLVVFVGLLAGLAVAIAYHLARRWLPAKAWQAGLLTALVVFAVFGAAVDLLAADNKDFRLLTPVWLAVVLISGTALLLGLTTGAVYDRLDRGMPTLSRRPKVMAAYVPLLAFAMTIFVLPAVVLIVVVGGAAAPAVTHVARSPTLIRWGQRVVVVAAAFSAFVVASNAFEVLTLE